MTLAEHRIGQPNPLIYHLGAAVGGYQAGLTVQAKADAADFPWHPEIDRSLIPDPQEMDPLNTYSEILDRLGAMSRGIRLWQEHPYRRAMPTPPVIWQDGSTRLLDYGAEMPDAPPVVVIPSLVNRPYILDLGPETSLVRFLASKGLRPFLLEWGEPGHAETGFDLQSYCQHRAMPAIEKVRALGGRPPALLGYCMGGTLATAIAASGRTEISCLVTLGAPWNLGGSRGVAKVLRAFWHAKPGAGLDHTLDTMGNTFGAIPVAFFQYLFALINPMQAAVKFRKFADLDQDSPAAFNFAAIEDWLADGIPMTPPAAKDLLVSWFVDNALATGTWRFLGAPVDPAAIRVPSLVICGVSDSITPLSVAQPLGTAIPGAVTLQPHTGHVGMIVGKSARSMVWDPIAGFLHANVHRIT